MDTALQIVAGGAQVAQFLRLHYAFAVGRGFDFRDFRGNDSGVEFGQLRLARRDVEGKFIVETSVKNHRVCRET